MTPASLLCPQAVVVPTGTPNVQLPNEVLFRVHSGRLIQTLPVPGPNMAAIRNAVAPIVRSIQCRIIIVIASIAMHFDI